ncbi:autotransporter TcfA [Bordetella pertussis]|uniref:Tcf protein n=1 Tax=Bordetella pertussis TaxID=520 RepID=Q8VV97_BORPT|nr:autotransporter TcfA [Bordetella pertussis]ULY76823.1 autotransporter TcfA [Bordetella pertussis]ULY80302.1 autotransporter TcfA [Bordetella pertussis]ULZ99668.1 autotransporter TcfA [Bordetella pertussis]CAD12826.1 Tcf protein [Bordetella pertussis]
MHIYGNMNRATPCRGAVRALALALLGAGMWTLSPPSAWALKLPSLLTDDELKLVLPTGMSLEDFKRSLQESAPSALATPPSSSPPVAKPGPGSVAEAPSGSGHKDNPSPPVVGVGPGMAESSGGHNPGVGGGTHENGLPGIGKVGGSAPGPDTSTGSGPDAGMASGAGSTSPGASDGAGKDAMPPSEGERPDSGMSDSGRGGESSAGGLNPDGAGKPPREEGEPGSKSPADGGQDGPPPPRDGGDADPQPPRDDGNGEQQPPKGGGDEGQRPPPAAGNGGNGGNGNAQLPERGDDAGPKPPEGEGGDEGPQPPQGGGEQDAPEVPPVAPAPPAGNGVYDPGTHTLTTPASAAVSLASSSHGVWQAEMNALSKRMGELRLTPVAGGVWGRAFGRRQDVDNRVSREFRQTISGFELGADTALPVADGRWHVGAVAGYTNGRIKFDRGGTGDDDSVHVGAYATYIEDGGFYMDGIVRVSRIRHAFKVDDAKGRRVRGQYRGNGVGASLELGKRFTWPGAWYVEPQLEVAAFHAQGADYTASNGLRIKDDGTNSMLGRLGLHVGRQFDLGDGRVVQPYMKLSWVQEFDGKGTVRTNDIRHKVRLDGGRTELAVGVASQLGKHGSLFGSYEYAKGSRQTMPWTFHVGYRYAW